MALAVSFDLEQPLRLHQVAGRGVLATQADEQIAADVWMAGDAAERAGQNLVLEAAVLEPAAAAVFDGNHAVDVGEILELGFVEPLGDVLADRGGAVDRRNHRQVIPRPGFAARPAVTQKRPIRDRCRRRRNGGAAGVVLDEIPLVQVMGMNVIAGIDALGRRANDLAVFVDLVSLGNRADGDLVAELDGLVQRDRSAGDFQVVALFEVAGGDADVVIGVEVDGVGEGAGHGACGAGGNGEFRSL